MQQNGDKNVRECETCGPSSSWVFLETQMFNDFLSSMREATFEGKTLTKLCCSEGFWCFDAVRVFRDTPDCTRVSRFFIFETSCLRPQWLMILKPNDKLNFDKSLLDPEIMFFTDSNRKHITQTFV